MNPIALIARTLSIGALSLGAAMINEAKESIGKITLPGATKEELKGLTPFFYAKL